MKRIFQKPSAFIPHHKRIKKANGRAPGSISLENKDYSIFDKRGHGSHNGYPKGFIKPDMSVESERQPDYLEQFKQYSWPEETYRNNQEPFFTGKDPLNNFIKPAKISVNNNSPVNNEADSEAQNCSQDISVGPNRAQEIIKEIISQRQLDYKEFYEGEATEQDIFQSQDGAEQNTVQYQNEAEKINQAMGETFPTFEIKEAINEIKETNGVVQDQDLAQPGADSQANNAEEFSEQFGTGLETNLDYNPMFTPQPEPEIAQEGIAPLAEEAMPDGMEQNLDDIAQQQPQEMMQEPPPDPFTVPGLFGPYMPLM